MEYFRKYIIPVMLVLLLIVKSNQDKFFARNADKSEVVTTTTLSLVDSTHKY